MHITNSIHYLGNEKHCYFIAESPGFSQFTEQLPPWDVLENHVNPFIVLKRCLP